MSETCTEICSLLMASFGLGFFYQTYAPFYQSSLFGINVPVPSYACNLSEGNRTYLRLHIEQFSRQQAHRKNILKWKHWGILGSPRLSHWREKNRVEHRAKFEFQKKWDAMEMNIKFICEESYSWKLEILFWLRKTSLSVETYQLSFHGLLFISAFHPGTSSFFQ